MPLSEFEDRMEEKERETRGSRPAEGFEKVLMPGDLEHQKRWIKKKKASIFRHKLVRNYGIWENDMG